MNDFAAIDFETANQFRTSVCSVGVVIVRGGVVCDSFYSLIRPEPEFYHWMNTNIHVFVHGNIGFHQCFFGHFAGQLRKFGTKIHQHRVVVGST